MSFLWRKKVNQPINLFHKKPSPKHNNHILNFAQSLISVLDRLFPEHNKYFYSIKRISVFISGERRLKASMTVEAAMVLPLFIFFFLNLTSAIEMIRLHGNLQLALWDVGNRLSVYGSISDNEKDSLGVELAAVALSYTYVNAQINSFLDVEYLDNSPLSRGHYGLQFAESDIWESKDCFELAVTYGVSPMSSMAGFLPFRMANKYYGHFWNGYEIPREEQYVYVAENGEVYHMYDDCTYLNISTRQIPLQEALQEVNEQGRAYSACAKCENISWKGEVYVTDEGRHYHTVGDCPGIKRTVACVWISEAEDMELCTRCRRAIKKEK